MQQRTLRRPIDMQGIGLHSGRMVSLELLPAPIGHGVRFSRVDLPGRPSVPAHFRYVVNTQMATTLGLGKATVGTVEHLMAALQGEGIDNVMVEVDGPELPVMDGSSAPFCEAIRHAGAIAQDQERLALRVKRRVEAKLAGKWAVAEPSAPGELEVFATIDWDHPAIGFQECHYSSRGTEFLREIAPARTFGFAKEVEALKRMGLARGGSLDNAVVLDDARVLNPGGLRFNDEFARHKVLDALGDFKLAGIAIEAKVRLHRAGHELHRLLLSEIFRDRANYELSTHVDGRTESGAESGVRLATRVGLASA